MKTSPRFSTCVAATLCAVAALSAMSAAHAEYRCDTPRTPLDERVCAIAAQGPADLRRFIQRTRPIYGFDFHDYANESTYARWDARRSERRAIERADSAPQVAHEQRPPARRR